MILRAGDLLLRPPEEGDAAAIAAACADPDIPRFIPAIPVPYTEADARAWLAEQEELRETQGEHNFVVLRGERFLGVVGIRAWEGGTIGYWLAPEARGDGVMAQAVRAVVDWARGEHGIRKLAILAHADNVASQRVAERAGFKRVGPVAHGMPFRDGSTSAVRYEIG